MNILVCHNFYQRPGGEDRVFTDEVELLRRHGHNVQTYTADNHSIDSQNQITVAGRALWNNQSHREIWRIVHRTAFDIVHFHNTFPLISPSAYHAAASAGAGIVQTLHNYRLMCANGTFFREGQRCEKCLGKSLPLAAIAHRCYRDSLGATAVAAAVSTAHRALGTWRQAVDVYIAPTDFARTKFIAGGLPPQKIVVKPHFVFEDNGPGAGDGNYALFVGRLSPEKGIATLLNAWRMLARPIPLKIAGDGPLYSLIPKARAGGVDIQWLGHQPPEEINRLLKGAKFVVMPSEFYETFGRVAIESLAAGTPVIAASGTALAEIIEDGVTGVHFEAGSAVDLAAKVQRMSGDQELLAKMRLAAGATFARQYTAEGNYPLLQYIYTSAINRRRRAA